MIKRSELDEFKQEFLRYIEIEHGRSVKTVENYDHYLSRFLKHSSVRKPEDITSSVVSEFHSLLSRKEVRSARHGVPAETLKQKTQNYHLIALRAFLKYLRKRGVMSLKPECIELTKADDCPPNLITDAELVRLLEAPEGEDLKALRDRALLHVLFSTGLRVSEICALDVDMDLSRDELSIQSKGGKMRIVFLNEKAKETIRTWLKARKDTEEALFINVGRRSSDLGDNRLTSRSVQRIIKHYAAKAGITRKVTPHTIRRAFASNLLGSGAGLDSVQALLGHANISTTQVYTHSTEAHQQEVHNKSHGKKQ